MFAAAALALLVTLALVVVRAALGPTVFDRVQAGNTIGTVALLLLSVLGFLTGRPEFLDLALTYGLLNIIGTVAVLKFFRYGDLGDPGDDARPVGSVYPQRVCRAGPGRLGRFGEHPRIDGERARGGQRIERGLDLLDGHGGTHQHHHGEMAAQQRHRRVFEVGPEPGQGGRDVRDDPGPVVAEDGDGEDGR